MTGHALSGPSFAVQALSIGFDYVHIAAAATWVGGIFVLVMILFAAPSEARSLPAWDLAWRLFAQFTPIATACVCLVVASGIYATVVHVGNIANLMGSIYGRLLVAKVAGVIALLLLGYRHMRLGTGRVAGSGRATLLGESILGVAVVALTAGLIGQMPPAHMTAMPVDTMQQQR
jgi:putative copper export protein